MIKFDGAFREGWDLADKVPEAAAKRSLLSIEGSRRRGPPPAAAQGGWEASGLRPKQTLCLPVAPQRQAAALSPQETAAAFL